MRIDTTQIPNFDTLPEEAKNAILAMEFEIDRVGREVFGNV